MILPEDQEIIIAMVGTSGFDLNAPPSGFVDEYLLRLGMLSRAGKMGPLGHIGMVHLLREFQIAPVAKKEPEQVGDWTNINQGTPVLIEGRKGTYFGPSGAGFVLVQLEGQRMRIEVPKASVTVAPSVVDGLSESDFKREPDPPAAKLTEAKPELVEKPEANAEPKPEIKKAKNAAAGVRVDDQPPEPNIDQEVLNKWGLVEPGTPVQVQIGGKQFPAEFSDCQKDDKLSVVIDGKKKVVSASDVTLAEVVTA